MGEVEEKVIPFLNSQEQVAQSEDPGPVQAAPVQEKVYAKEQDSRPLEEVVGESTPTLSNVGKKKAIKAYIDENYPDNVMPKLSRDQVNEWYELVQAEEELPFDSTSDENEVGQADLKSQLSALMG